MFSVLISLKFCDFVKSSLITWQTWEQKVAASIPGSANNISKDWL